MKKILLLCITALCCLACNQPQSITVTVSNPTDLKRTNEMVEVSMAEVSNRLQLADTAQIVVLDENGQQVPYQITYDEKLIFPTSTDAKASSTYTIQPGSPLPVEAMACGRQYPERMDDLAWENDLTAYRAYGPALQQTGERGFGYDLFTKYNTTEPVLEDMYAKELNPDSWKQVNELKKTDPQAAEELKRSFTYHVDHGFGMDCYAVGPTLGAGVAALMDADTLIYPWCYRDCEILDNGPLRFTAKLTFAPIRIKNDSCVVETRLISLDAGSQLNKTIVSYEGLQETMPIAAGIVLHEPDGQVTADAQKGYISYVDPTTGSDNGKIFLGIALPAGMTDAKTVLFSEQEKKQRNNADGHVLALSQYEPGGEFTYYWGFAWSKAAIKTPEAWNQYMADYVKKLQSPLKVSME